MSSPEVDTVGVEGEKEASSLEQERAARKAKLLARQEAAKKRKAVMDAKAAKEKEEEEREEAEEDSDEEEEEEEEVEVRESMVENAVKFLSNESVKKTPLVRRVAFLEKKGLTQAEITTAMQRVSGGGGAQSSTVVTAKTTAPAKKVKKKTVRKIVYEDEDDAEEEVVVVRKAARTRPQSAGPPLPPPMVQEAEKKGGWTWLSLATTTFVALGAVGGLVALARSMAPQKGQEREREREREREERQQLPSGGSATPAGRQLQSGGEQSHPYSTPPQYGRGPPYGGTPQYQPKTPAQQVEELKDQMSELVKVVTTQQSTLQKVQSALTNNTARQASPSSSTAAELEKIDVQELKSAISQLQQLLADGSKTPARLAATPAGSGGAVGGGGVTPVTRLPPQASSTPLQRTATPAALAPATATGAKVTGTSAAALSAANPSYLATAELAAPPSASQPENATAVAPTYTPKYSAAAAAASAYAAAPATRGVGAQSPASSSVTTTVNSSPAPRQSAAAATPQASPAGYSKSFMDVMNMVQRGEEVPGIRTDIDDSPADPEQVVQTGATPPPPKPWETRLKARQERFARPAAAPAPSYLSPKTPAPEEEVRSPSPDVDVATGPKVEDITDESDAPLETKREEPEE